LQFPDFLLGYAQAARAGLWLVGARVAVSSLLMRKGRRIRQEAVAGRRGVAD
jgi:hypothetical protein